MVKNNRNLFNCSVITFLLELKLIFLQNKYTNIPKTFSYHSLYCLTGSLFFVVIGIDFVEEQGQQQQQQQYQYNIINIAWAENINGKKMQITLLVQ